MVSTEIDQKILTPENMSNLKRFTSDEVTARALYSNRIVRARFNAGIIMESNDVLFQCADGGLARRLTVVMFAKKLFSGAGGFDPGNPLHLDVSWLPEDFDRAMSERDKSAFVHILLRYLFRELQPYQRERDLAVASESALQRILNAFVSVERYNEAVGKGPREPLFARVHASNQFASQREMREFVRELWRARARRSAQEEDRFAGELAVAWRLNDRLRALDLSRGSTYKHAGGIGNRLRVVYFDPDTLDPARPNPYWSGTVARHLGGF